MSAPDSVFNVEIGPHRRFQMTQTDLADLKRVKDAHGGTVNDVILSIVAGGIGKYLRARGHDTDGLELRAMVPVSVRADEEHGALGNRISAMMAPLPVWCEDPVERLQLMTGEMGDLKSSGQAVGAEILTKLTDFAPSTIASQAARLQPAQRFFNLVVTNVPGPQFPLYVLGRKMESIFPMVPLARRQALCIGIMSYNGQVNFGLIGDYDAMADLDSFALDLEAATQEVIETAPAQEEGESEEAQGRRGRPTAPPRSPPSAPRGRALADQPAADLEREPVGQVVPVEVADVEAAGASVGVDDDRGDPLEAPGPAQPHRQLPPAAAEVEAHRRPGHGARRRSGRPAPAPPRCRAAPPDGRPPRARRRGAGTRSSWKVVWFSSRVSAGAAERQPALARRSG